MEAGELPIILECEKRQLTYLWILLISEDQLNDILDIQLKAYKSNTSCLANHVLHLLKNMILKNHCLILLVYQKISGKSYCRKSQSNLT